MVARVDTIILAIIQGVTEWFPISSSGHLVIFQELRGIIIPVSFDIGLHLGSVFALGLYFRRNILASIQQRDLSFSSVKEKQIALYLVLSGVSTVIVVFALNDVIRLVFTDLRAIGLGLIVTALFLGLSRMKTGHGELSKYKAVLIGIAQGVAAIPGISRSGLTFSAGLLSGMDRELVFTYSMLLSVPTIIGATILESRRYSSIVLEGEVLALGIVITTVVGYFSIALLKKVYDKTSGLDVFIPYCVILGAVLIAIT
ncbi:MAG: undecaprenyl-diphosphate phosphatase [Candidatus Bathyarchaeota archaeon]|nr:undecaprenyl-diphosphate phosphatase [Candidatus Bathyarchaeota archaeon]